MVSNSGDSIRGKREKSVIFDKEETAILLMLVELNGCVIESKKTDALTWQKQETAWSEIEEMFNCLSDSTYRDREELRLKYETLKWESIIKDMTEEYYQIEGVSSIDILTPAQQKLKQMIPEREGNENHVLRPKSNNNTDNEFTIKGSKTHKEKLCEAFVEEESRYPKDNRKENNLLNMLLEEKLETARIRKRIMQEEFEHKLIQRTIIEAEVEHTYVRNELEKQHMLLKLKLLRMNLN